MVTALAAAPTHRRLGAGPDRVLLHHLQVVDRARTAAAALALIAALAAAVVGSAA